MSTTRQATADRQRRLQENANRTYLRDLEQTYLRWQRFVAEEQARLDLEQRTSRVDDLTQPQRSASRVRSRLSRAEHHELSDIFEQRRRQLGYAPDAEGTASLLHHIRNELAGLDAEGEPLPDGWAVVWYGGGLKQIDHRRIVGRMSAADYARTLSPRLLAVSAVIGMMGLCLVIAVVRLMLSTATQTTTTTIRLGKEAITLAPMEGAAVGATALHSRLVLGSPMVLCVDDAAVFSPTTEDTLVITRTTSIQTYTLLPGTPAAVAAVSADVVVADCQERPARPLYAAHLRDSRAAQPSAHTVIQSVVVAGPDTDAAHIAADQMLVTITLAKTAGDAPILVLADGTRWPAAQQSGSTLQYLVPFTPSPQQAALEHPSATGPPMVVPVELAAPLDRTALLHTQLTVRLVAARRVADGVELDAQLTARGTTPVALVASDVALATDRGVTLPITWTPVTLKPGPASPITIRAAYVPQAPLTVVVCGDHFTLTPAGD